MLHAFYEFPTIKGPVQILAADFLDKIKIYMYVSRSIKRIYTQYCAKRNGLLGTITQILENIRNECSGFESQK